MIDAAIREYHCLCYKRSALAIGCTIIIQYIILVVLVLLVKYLYPGVIREKPDAILELSTYSLFSTWRIAFLSLTCVVHGIYLTSHLIAPVKSYSSKTAFQCEKLVKDSCVLGFYGLMGVLTGYTYYLIIDFDGDFYTHAEICDEAYLIHQQLPYVCLNGAFSLICLQIRERKNLQWRIPVIHQCKKVQFSSNILCMLWKSVIGSLISALAYWTLYLVNLRSKILNTACQDLSLFGQRTAIYPSLTSFQILFISHHLHFLIPLFIAERFQFVLQHNFACQRTSHNKLSDSFPLVLGSAWLDVLSTTTLNSVANVKIIRMHCCSIISSFEEFMSCLNGPSKGPKTSYTMHRSNIGINREKATRIDSGTSFSFQLNCSKNCLGKVLKSSSLGNQAQLNCWCQVEQNEHITNMIRMVSCFNPSITKSYPGFAVEDLSNVIGPLLELKNKLEYFANTVMSQNRNKKCFPVQKAIKRSLYRLITAFEVSLVENCGEINLDRFVKYLE